LATNNGVGVIATGDNVIKNIYFKDTFSSAINYDNATDLTVQDCLITGHNQGNVIVDVDAIFTAGLQAAGIQGKNGNSGETLIEHVIIRNNKNGTGITDYTTNAAHRELTVCNCEFSGLNNTGIFTPLAVTNTSSNVVVKDSYFHDITNGNGIFCEPFSGTTETVCVKSSLFDNVGASILGNFPPVTAFPKSGSDLKILVDACSFENATTGAVLIQNTSSLKSEAIVENSIGNNVGIFFQSQVVDNGVQHNRLCGNTVTGGTFYEAQAFHSLVTLPMPVEITEIIGNCFTGSTGSIGIELIPSIAWTLLDITAECNCFYGSGTGSILFDTITSATPGKFNGLINAHENTFSGFTTDIKDNGSNVSYLVSRNFWGTPTTTCSTTSPCPTFQTCEHGSCLGPIVVAPAPPYTGFIDASHPLAVSIKCPRNCCFSKSGTPTPPPLLQAVLSTEEKLQKLERIRESIKNGAHKTTAGAVVS